MIPATPEDDVVDAACRDVDSLGETAGKPAFGQVVLGEGFAGMYWCEVGHGVLQFSSPAIDDFRVSARSTASSTDRCAVPVVGQRVGLVVRGAEHFGEQFLEVEVSEAVDAASSVFARLDESCEFEFGEVLGDRGPRGLEILSQRGHVVFALPEEPEDSHPCGVGEHPEQDRGGVDDVVGRSLCAPTSNLIVCVHEHQYVIVGLFASGSGRRGGLGRQGDDEIVVWGA